MATPVNSPLHLFLPRWAPFAALLAFASLGLAMGNAVLRVPVEQVPDLTLRLAALLTAPLPLLVLQVVSTPPHAATRRMLGETATQVLAASRRDVLRWTAVFAVAPLAMGLQGLRTDAALLMHVASVLGATVPLVAGLSLAAMLHGLRVMARGKNAGWTAVSGGGAFGPAEAAPLLYLPAFALIGGLAPVAFLAAVWNARPEWLTPTVWRFLPVVGALLGLRFAARAVKHTRAHVHAGLRAAEQAHASRFAQSDGLAEPPVWLTLGVPPEPLRFLARAWHRRWPLSALATAALAATTFALIPSDAPAWTWFVTGCGFAFVAYSRVLSLDAEPAWHATRWLGVTVHARRHSATSLGFGLAVPVLLLAGISVWQRQGATLLGLVAGIALGWSWMANTWKRPVWIQRSAWLVYGAGLIAAVVGAK